MALPSVTIGGNTQYMNPGIQVGAIGVPAYGGSVMMPQTTTSYAAPAVTSYAQPAMSYGTSVVMSAPAYTTTAAPTAVSEVFAGGREYIVAGTDANRDGIPDAVERPVTTAYVSQAPAVAYAAPALTTTAALPTTASMVAYPQTQGPFVFYPASEYNAAPAAKPVEAKRDVKVAKKKKAGSCACCCPAKKAPAKKK